MHAHAGGAIAGEYALHKVFDQMWENANKGVSESRPGPNLGRVPQLTMITTNPKSRWRGMFSSERGGFGINANVVRVGAEAGAPPGLVQGSVRRIVTVTTIPASQRTGGPCP